MYSLHKLKHQQRAKALSEHQLKILNTRSKSPYQNPNRLADSSKRRLFNYCQSITTEEKNRNTQVVLKTGTVPLVSHKNHSFRGDCNCPKIYLKNYMPESEKIKKSISDHKSAFLEPEKYAKINPNKISASSVKLESRQSKSSRIQQKINQNTNLNPEPFDRFKAENPVFRETSREKWLGSEDFKKYIKIKSFPQETYDPPFSEEVFESTLRKREKEKELFKYQNFFKKDSWMKLVPKPVSNANYLSSVRSRSILRSSKLYIKSLNEYTLI